ncbi:uncharacterized protein LOC120695352 [Panicum virgatum]|uniref:uncharacterized protein LOC120695352 n=1 Tax=Panicum virgatum TaxID=38727 RepID=UPI0019D69899|nr:uncharacterized protein LOC120695352 [Panicum virgatum]
MYSPFPIPSVRIYAHRDFLPILVLQRLFAGLLPCARCLHPLSHPHGFLRRRRRDSRGEPARWLELAGKLLSSRPRRRLCCCCCCCCSASRFLVAARVAPPWAMAALWSCLRVRPLARTHVAVGSLRPLAVRLLPSASVPGQRVEHFLVQEQTDCFCCCCRLLPQRAPRVQVRAGEHQGQVPGVAARDGRAPEAGGARRAVARGGGQGRRPSDAGGKNQGPSAWRSGRRKLPHLLILRVKIKNCWR